MLEAPSDRPLRIGGLYPRLIEPAVGIDRTVVAVEAKRIGINLLGADRGKDNLHVKQLATRAAKGDLIAQMVSGRTVRGSIILEGDEYLRSQS